MTRETYISGVYRKSKGYEYFLPSLVNCDYQCFDPTIVTLLEEAAAALGELNAYSHMLPDISYFVQMHIAKEATSSSRIEGTKTNIEEIFHSDEGLSQERKNDRQEVLNYIASVNWSIAELDRVPLSMRLLKGAHKILLSGVRGEHKLPGELRKSQNWIGGATLQDAYFIPPCSSELGDLLSDLEKFWHNDELHTPQLIKAAISHYQFETIHPFLDGNGRLGRLLIILQLLDRGLLVKPTLYLSAYFDKYRDDYYDALTYVRTKNNMDYWLKFFLRGIVLSAQHSRNTLLKIVELRADYNQRIAGLSTSRQKHATKLLLACFTKPNFSVNEIAELLGVSYPTANALVEDFLKLGLFKEAKQAERNRLFELHEYLVLFN